MRGCNRRGRLVAAKPLSSCARLYRLKPVPAWHPRKFFLASPRIFFTDVKNYADVGQDGILRPIGNRPLRFRSTDQADYQSAAGCHPAPHPYRW